MGDATKVDPADPAKKTSEIVGPTSDEATVQMSQLDRKCWWNGAEYDQGARIDAGGDRYECSFGKWVPLD